MKESELKLAGFKSGDLRLLRKWGRGEKAVYTEVPLTDLPLYIAAQLEVECEFLKGREEEYPDSVRVLYADAPDGESALYLLMFPGNKLYPVTETPSSG